MRNTTLILARALTATVLVILSGCGSTDDTDCEAGQCPAPPIQCPSGQAECGGACVSTQSNVAHCGACNNACGAGQSCEAGQCKAPQIQCSTGQTKCSGVCVDLQNDPNQCGTCGLVCPSGRCSAGQCQPVNACGNGTLTSPEACDDANSASGDGCSASCAIEGGWECRGTPSLCQKQEAEPNDTRPTATPVPGGLRSVVLRGAISPSSDVDLYRLTVASAADLRLDTFDGSYTGTGAGTCADIDTFLELQKEDGTVLVSDDDSGTGFCSSLTPQDNPEVARLPAGTYYIRVRSFGTGSIPAYTLRIQLQALCGDSLREGTEQCDDGNTTAGDRCSATCRAEKVPEEEGNDTVAAAQNLASLPSLIGGSISPGTDKDVFRFTLSAISDVQIETLDGSYTGENPKSCETIDTLVELVSADGAVLDDNDDSGINSCSLLGPDTSRFMRRMSPGTYFARVSSYNATALSAYSVSFQVLSRCGDGIVAGSEECDGGTGCTATCERVPVCGDGFLDYPEACDDNNTANGDNCSSTCQFPGMQPEVEPNGTRAEADARASASPPVLITRTTTGISSGFQNDQDVDVYKLQLQAAATVRLETVRGSLTTCSPGLDTVLRLLDAQGAELDSDDDGGNDLCSLLEVPLQAGTYYVTVDHLTLAEPQSYGLRVTFP